jgi:hypothetical protein
MNFGGEAPCQEAVVDYQTGKKFHTSLIKKTTLFQSLESGSLQ